MKRKKLYLGICLSVFALVVVSVGIFTFTQDKGSAEVLKAKVISTLRQDKSSLERLKVKTVSTGTDNTCYASGDLPSNFYECEPSRDPNAVAKNITVVIENLSGDSLRVAIAEDLKNYEDAYYNFSTGHWNCGTGDINSDQYVTLQSGETKTFEIHVEGSHSTFFGEMKVQNLYLLTHRDYDDTYDEVLNFSFVY
jgi:hypothetical protein